MEKVRAVGTDVRQEDTRSGTRKTYMQWYEANRRARGRLTWEWDEVTETVVTDWRGAGGTVSRSQMQWTGDDVLYEIIVSIITAWC